MKSSLEIAQEAKLRPIEEVAADLGLAPDELELHGRYRAKVLQSASEWAAAKSPGKLVVVTAVTPTQAGEGKTTSAIALADGLARSGRSAVLALREPSMGPVFGIKGGGAGGGMVQVAPMESINLHFNGDLHAVTAAHDLLSAALDASLYHHNPLGIDASTISWPRCLDVNDRALRNTVIGLGGKVDGVPRQGHFIITAASEVMAILALARDLLDLRARLGRIIVAHSLDGHPITADDLEVAGAMTVLLKDALLPNLVQTLEGTPVLIHAGPFGNIAHGNNSIRADALGLGLADILVTEAGFAADLGFEKFCHISCRYGDIKPSAAVVVATVRAIKSHGGGDDDTALKIGADNLGAHVAIVHSFGLPCVVAINRFPDDSDSDVGNLRSLAEEMGADEVVVHTGFMDGGAGAGDFAEAVARAVESPNEFMPLYGPETKIVEQLEILAEKVYGADGIELTAQAKKSLEWLAENDLDRLPVCVAKTHLSLSHDPKWKGLPIGFMLPVRDLIISAGAGFVVAPTGDISLMPGLGSTPAYKNIDIDEDGRTTGLS